jgi:voltage-gated potassium channel
MSVAKRVRGFRLRWYQATKTPRRALERHVALDRWYPHILIGVAMAPLGLILVTGAVEGSLGIQLFSVEIADIERNVGALRHTPILEFVLGLLLIALSIGVTLRSRLAWLWSTVATALALALRLFGGESLDLPISLYLLGILAMLLIHRRRIASGSVVASSVSAVVVLLTFFTWATLGTLRLGEQFDPPIREAATALYVAVVTVSSVGYGDFVPSSPEARLFVVAMISLGILVIATTVGAILLPLIGSGLREFLGGKTRMDRNNHYVIVGKSPLARSATLELEKRKQSVTVILAVAPDEDFYHQRDVVIGDPADLSVLRTAGTEKAKGVLALSTDDATNGFVVLGVNELDATIPTVAALNDASNRFRLKRTQPSMLLSLQALGGELLAMALTGERVDAEMLDKVLQIHGSDPTIDD